MIIGRSSNSRNAKTPVNNIKMMIDLSTFNILCRYVISSSTHLRINHLINLRKLIESLDMSTYANDPEKIKRVNFIRRGLDARITYNLTESDMIINHIKSGLDFDIDFINWDAYELNSDEILWVHNLVSESLKYFFIYPSADDLLDICTRIKSSDYAHRGNLINELESKIDRKSVV